MPMLSRRVRLSSKGQLVIPQEMREQLGLKAGDEIVLHLVAGRLLTVEVPELTPLQQALARLDEYTKDHPVTPAEVERALEEAREEVYLEQQQRASAA
jgi:AbrB family looped-hinge helix DNA binding protein